MITFVKIIGVLTIFSGLLWIGIGLLGIIGQGDFVSYELLAYPILGILALATGIGLLKQHKLSVYGYLVIAAIELFNDYVIKKTQSLGLGLPVNIIIEITIFLILMHTLKKSKK